MCAVTLIMSLLENVPGIDSNLNGIIGFFINELNVAKIPEYR